MRETANQSKFAKTMHHIEVRFNQLAPSIDDVRWLSVSFALLWLVIVVWPHANGHKINGIHGNTAASRKSINRKTKAESFWPFYVRAALSSSNIGHYGSICAFAFRPASSSRLPNLHYSPFFFHKGRKRKTRRQRTEWKDTCQCRDK